jgi:AcrR family transcriptional regulator
MSSSVQELPRDEPSRDNAKLRQVLEGARRVFLADGFDGASMNDIAREAGVSKGTLYVYFDSKEALFVALIREERAHQAERLCDFDTSSADVVEVLRIFGRSLLQKMTRPDSVAHIRTVIAAAGKFPEIGRAFYTAGPQHGIDRLSEYLAVQSEAGHLSIDDPRLAASHYLQLCQGDLFRRVLFAMIETVEPADIETVVEEALELFMKVYGPAPAAP